MDALRRRGYGMPPVRPLAWLSQAREAFEAVYGRVRRPLTVTIADPDGQSVSYTLVDALTRAGAPEKLTPLARRVLAVCGAVPQTVKRIAARLGKAKPDTYLRETLRDLCRRNPPLLMQTPDGYRLPG